MDPRADERKEPIICGWQAKVRHLPMHPNSRNSTLQTRCGKVGWFWRPGLMNEWLADVKAGKVKPPKLPFCAECMRRYERESQGYRKCLRWLVKRYS